LIPPTRFFTFRNPADLRNSTAFELRPDLVSRVELRHPLGKLVQRDEDAAGQAGDLRLQLLPADAAELLVVDGRRDGPVLAAHAAGGVLLRCHLAEVSVFSISELG
jgi:hypothetical protein